MTFEFIQEICGHNYVKRIGVECSYPKGPINCHEYSCPIYNKIKNKIKGSDIVFSDYIPVYTTNPHINCSLYEVRDLE